MKLAQQSEALREVCAVGPGREQTVLERWGEVPKALVQEGVSARSKAIRVNRASVCVSARGNVEPKGGGGLVFSLTYRILFKFYF